MKYEEEYKTQLNMKDFKIVRYQVSAGKYGFGQRIRIVLLSDLHNQRYGRKNEVLIRAIDRLKPDLVAAAGDMFTPQKERTEFAALHLMEALAEKYPVFYGNGFYLRSVAF